jgi:hypothetical protein
VDFLAETWLGDLLKLGGFLEPFLSGSEVEADVRPLTSDVCFSGSLLRALSALRLTIHALPLTIRFALTSDV